MNDDELVDAFAAALRADPPEVDAKTAAARAMERADEVLVERAAELLAQDPPLPRPAATGRDSAAPALPRSAGGGRGVGDSKSRRAEHAWWAAAAVALIAVSAGLYTVASNEPPPLIAEQHVGAHRIIADGAEYEVDERDGAVVVALARGEALFVVAPLEDRTFVVNAGDTSVRVTGTVFSVSREGDRVGVRVYEGSVEVRRGASIDTLRAGQSIGDPVAPQIATRGREEAIAREEPRIEERPRAPSDDEIRRLIAGGQHREAIAASERALRARPRSSELWMLRGDAFRGRGNREDAVRAYERAMDLGDANERAIAGLSAARLIEDRARALDTLERSGALEERSPVRSAAAALRDRLIR